MRWLGLFHKAVIIIILGTLSDLVISLATPDATLVILDLSICHENVANNHVVVIAFLVSHQSHSSDLVAHHGESCYKGWKIHHFYAYQMYQNLYSSSYDH